MGKHSKRNRQPCEIHKGWPSVVDGARSQWQGEAALYR